MLIERRASHHVGILTSGVVGWLLLALFVIGLAAVAGYAVATIGDRYGERAAYMLAILCLAGLACLVAVTRKEPLRFVFLVLFICFPFAGALVPPGRFGITVFDAVTIALAVALVARRLSASDILAPPLFPTRSWQVAGGLWAACVVFSQFPFLSAIDFALLVGAYAFFLLCLEELGRADGFARLTAILSAVLLAMALGLFAEALTQVNFSLRGTNINQLSFDTSGAIFRSGGFFQDPQLAGAFLSGVVTFLLVLAVRGRFRSGKLRFLVWTAIIAGLAAMPTTVSRGAILSSLFVSATALFIFNTWRPHAKLAMAAVVLCMAGFVAQLSPEALMSALPPSLAGRFVDTGLAMQGRVEIWFDTWEMFAEHPLTGIGPGSFQAYLLETRPGVYNYYGIGLDTGVTYVPGQAESGYFTILYECGLVGSAAILLVAGDAIRRALSVIFRKGALPEARTEVIAALTGITTFAITSITRDISNDSRISGVLMLYLAVIWYRSLQAGRKGHG